MFVLVFDKFLIVCLYVWMDVWMDLMNSWDELDREWVGLGNGFGSANGFG